MGSLRVSKRDKLFVSFCFCNIHELDRFIPASRVDIFMPALGKVYVRRMTNVSINTWLFYAKVNGVSAEY